MARVDLDAPPEERSFALVASAALLVLAGAAVYTNSFGGAFVFDDIPAIRDNPTLRSLWPLSDAFSPPANTGIGGRPFANFSFALNRAIGGSSVTSYHVGNLLLHVSSALLLFGVIRRALAFLVHPGALAIAFVTALLWVVHPLNTAAVSWLSQRTELLMALCYLATLYGFIRGAKTRSAGWFAFSVTACALGMTSKEVMVSAPVVVLLCDRLFVAGSLRDAWSQRKAYYAGLASTWLILGYLLTTGLSQRGVGFELGVSPLTYALTECRAWLLYLKLAVWPSPLIFDYGALFPNRTLATAVGVVAILGLAAWAFHQLRRNSVIGFAAAAFFLLLAPSSSFVPVASQPIAENRTYLPLAVLIATLVTTLHHLLSGHLRRLLPGAASALCLLTLARNVDYQSEVSLWADTARKRPENPRAHFNHGVALLDAKRAADAIAPFERALALNPNDPKAHNSLGNALLELDRPREALPHFAEATRLNPTYARAWCNHATALVRTGDAAAAIESFRRALRLDPSQIEAEHGLGNAHFQLDQPAAAISHYEAALRLDPTLADVHYSCGNACLEVQRVVDAIGHFAAAAALKPRDHEIRNSHGAALVRAGWLTEAIAQFEAALQLKPDYQDARDNLALVRTELARTRR